MTKDNWYRGGGWSKDDKRLFSDKISRSRSDFNKQQYARIKALALISTGDQQKLNGAIELLEQSLKKWCKDWMSKEEAYATLGKAYRYLGYFDKASVAYEESIGWHTNLVHTGYWDYPEMIITQKLIKKYGRAFEIVNTLLEKQKTLSTQTERFIYHAVRAIVLAHQNKLEEAYLDARSALSAKDVNKSIFKFHQNFGLVDKKKYDNLIKILEKI